MKRWVISHFDGNGWYEFAIVPAEGRKQAIEIARRYAMKK